MILSAADQTILRTHPQSSEVYLSIFQPRPIFAAQPTGTLARGAREITYYNVTTGSFSSIEAGMTLLVGTSAGGRELGKIRVKSATVSTITVAENSYIDWASATHLTVLRYWELWPVFPRIIPDPADNTNVIFYKDYDTAYTNQNSVLGAFPCAGPHRAIFAGESIYYSATGSYHLLGETLTYEWAFEGGTTTGSTSSVPGNITYSTPGHYVTRLKVTGGNGTVDTTYRMVSVYNNPKTSTTSLPQKNWVINNISGSRSEGGYLLDVSIVEKDITINDGDVVVLFTDDWYGSNNTSLGGNHPNASKIFLVGHVIGSSIRYNYKTTTVTFQVASVTDLMKKSEGFAVSVESKISPAKWFELLDMDGRRALYHYLRWHSTLLSIADFEWKGQDQKIQFYDSDRESIFDAIDNFMRNTYLGSVCADRQGKVWAEVGAWAVENPTGSFPPVMTLQKQDWVGEVSIGENLSPASSYLELGGVAYSGVITGTYDAFIACAPGGVPHVRGSVSRNQGMALASQTQLNAIVGHQYANKNARFPTVSFDLNGNYRNFDIAPQESVMVSASADETNIGQAISAPYLVNAMSWQYDSTNKVLVAHADLICLINGTAGETVTIPDIPDSGGFGDVGGGFNFGNLTGFPPMLLTLADKPTISGYGSLATDSGFAVPLVPASNKIIFTHNGFSFLAPPPGIYLTVINLHVDLSSSGNYTLVLPGIRDGSGIRQNITVTKGTDICFATIVDSTIEEIYPSSAAQVGTYTGYFTVSAIKIN